MFGFFVSDVARVKRGEGTGLSTVSGVSYQAGHGADLCSAGPPCKRPKLIASVNLPELFCASSIIN